MDASVFEAVGGEESPSLSELAALVDEDLRAPVAGAVAMSKHLLQFVVLVLTLTACVLLYIFVLAWICLFWAQSHLFAFTAQRSRNFAVKTIAARTAKLGSSIVTPPATIVKSQDALVEQTVSHPALSAESQKVVEPQKHTTTHISGTNNSTDLDIDYDTVLQEILLRENEIEAEIHQLVTEVAGAHSAQIINDAADDLRREKDDSFIVNESAGIPTPATGEFDEHGKNLATFSGLPQAATFKLTTRQKVVKPRIDYAEQLKEKKARDQLSFVNNMKAHSIVPSKNHKHKSYTTDAEHLRSVWGDMKATEPARSPHLTANGKTASPLKGPPKGPKPPPRRSAAKTSGQKVRPPQSTNAPDQPSAIPPHSRSSHEAKSRRAAVRQNVYEAKVKEREAVPTRNAFAALSDDAATANVPKPAHDDDDDAGHATSAGYGDANVAPFQPSILLPEPVALLHEQVELEFDARVKLSQPGDPADLAKATDETPKKRLVYTLEALQAANNSSTEIQNSTIADKAEEAALLIAHHTAGAKNRAISPRNQATGGWEFVNGTQVQAPSNVRGASPMLQNRRNSSLSVTSKAESVADAEKIIDVRFPGVRCNYQPAPSTSSTVDLEGLDFAVKASLDKPLSETHPPANTITLPGPPSFFASSLREKENDAPAPRQSMNSGWAPHEDVIAFNPYVSGPFQSSAYRHNQTLMQPYWPHIHRAEHRGLDIASDEMFPALESAEAMRNTISVPKPPGLGVALPNAQAAFDSLLPAAVPPQRSLDLGKFISTATTASAVTGAVSTAQAQNNYTILPSAVQDEKVIALESAYVGYETTFPKLPNATLPGKQAGNGVSQTKASTAEKKIAREALKGAWGDREEARLKLVSGFTLDGAHDLKRTTTLYLEKRSVLGSLMNSGVLNDKDAVNYPEFGLLELTVPKAKALTTDEMRSRKREAKTTLAEIAETDPLACPTPSDEVAHILKELVTAHGHRQGKIASQGPPVGTPCNKWRKERARADKVYVKKRTMLVEAYPGGLPKELELRFPQISLIPG